MVKTQKEKTKIEAAEIEFIRRDKICTKVEKIRNTDIREKLKIFNINPSLDE